MAILKLVTTEGIVMDRDDIESITIPTTTGEITIKDDHEPMLSTIAPGGVEVIDAQGETTLLAISRGVLEVQRESVVHILADTAEHAAQIDIERAEEAKRRAEEYLKNIDDKADIDFAMLEAKIAKELARVEVGKRWKG